MQVLGAATEAGAGAGGRVALTDTQGPPLHGFAGVGGFVPGPPPESEVDLRHFAWRPDEEVAREKKGTAAAAEKRVHTGVVRWTQLAMGRALLHYSHSLVPPSALRIALTVDMAGQSHVIAINVRALVLSRDRSVGPVAAFGTSKPPGPRCLPLVARQAALLCRLSAHRTAISCGASAVCPIWPSLLRAVTLYVVQYV